MAGSSKTSNDEEKKEIIIGELDKELTSLDVKLEEEIKDFCKTEADFRRKKEDHDVKVAAIKARKNKVQIQKERHEKEKMMRQKCNRPDCDNNGLHRCKRCMTVSVAP